MDEEKFLEQNNNVFDNVPDTSLLHTPQKSSENVCRKSRKRLFSGKPRNVELTPVAKTIYTNARKVLKVHYRTKVKLQGYLKFIK